MGIAFLIFNIAVLVASIFPFVLAKRVGCALVLVGSLLSTFIMIQVQAIVIVDARAYSGKIRIIYLFIIYYLKQIQ